MTGARSFLFPFKYSHKVAYIIEFSHRKIRIYAQRKLLRNLEKSTLPVVTEELTIDKIVLKTVSVSTDATAKNENTGSTDTGGGFPILEISSPYTYGDLWDSEEQCCKIQTIQHSDILYIFNENYPIKVLKRESSTNWSLETLELKNGPFMNMNTSDISIAASAVTGDITLKATGNVFTETDIGRLLRLRVYDDDTKPWQAGKGVLSGDIFYSDKKYYKSQEEGTTGSVKPVHSEGIRSDGSINWEYLHDGTGIVKITAVQDAQNASATVITHLPHAVKNGTVCWELGLLHQATKYPKSGAFFRNRFAFLINGDNGPNVCLSYSGDYNNFADMENGEATDETAITVPVLNTEFNEGKWIYARDVLFVGTGASEFYIDVISSASPLASDNVKIAQISRVGSKAIMPLSVGAHVIFVDRYGLSLRDLSYNYYNDGYDQIDISLLGKHLFQSRITAMAYQEVPDKVLWCLTADGSIAALTFSAEQEVAALSRHDISGFAESVAVIPNLDDCSDELWLEVRRTTETGSFRSVEWLDNGIPQYFPAEVSSAVNLAEKEKLQNDYVQKQSVYLDGSVVYEQSSAGDILGGLAHLEGQKVVLFADGVNCGEQKVSDGKITATVTFSRAVAGLKITSRFMPQNIFVPNDYGSGIGQKQRINHVLLMLYLSGGGEIGENEQNLTAILYRPADGVLNSAQSLFTGCKEVLFNGMTTEKEQAATLLIQNNSPLPMNILAIVPYMDVDE